MTKSYLTILLLPQVWLRVLRETGILATQPIQVILQHTTTLHDTEVSAKHTVPLPFPWKCISLGKYKFLFKIFH